MSIDSEDSTLEQALRDDLPSDETAARLRRKLLAAGVAIGTGTAAGTATAASAAPGLLASATAKLATVSWGVKLGLAAAVTIPTVGLLAERAEQPSAVVAPAAPPRMSAAARTPDPPVVAAPLPTTEPTAAEPASPPAASAIEPRAAASGLADAPPPAVLPTPAPPEATPPVAAAPFPTPAGAAASRAAFEGDAPTPPVTPSSTLAEETRLLDAAFAALSAGDREQARRLIQEHEARFPAGLLRRERERAKARLSEVTRGN